MKKMLINIVSCAIIATMVFAPITAFAADDTSNDYLDFELEDSAVGDGQARGVIGNCTISKVSDGRVYIKATTNSSKNENIKAVATLQWYKDNKWQNYSGGSVSASKAGKTVEASGTFNVSKGYSYRVIGSHFTGSGSTTSTSGSVQA